jgi:hypothetical protein
MTMTPQTDRRAKAMTAPDKNKRGVGATPAMRKAEDFVAGFVTKFAHHFRTCRSLAKQFTIDNPAFKQDYAAISQLCRASQEMLQQAKETRTLTEVYLALDEPHRDAVRPLITARFEEISKAARASWLRFGDSIELAQTTKREIEAAQRDFEPHANEFQQALRAFIAMSANAH